MSRAKERKSTEVVWVVNAKHQHLSVSIVILKVEGHPGFNVFRTLKYSQAHDPSVLKNWSKVYFILVPNWLNSFNMFLLLWLQWFRYAIQQ